MKENMLLQYADNIIKVELQSLRGEMLQFVANYAGGCSNAVDSAGRRLALQLEMKLAQATERMKEVNAEQRVHQEALLQQLVIGSRAQAARLTKLESTCLGASANDLANRSVRQVTAADGGQLEKSLTAMADDLQKARVQLDRSLRSAERHFLPSGTRFSPVFLSPCPLYNLQCLRAADKR